MRLKLIACEILYREVCAVVARSVNRVDIDFLPKGLHDIGQPGMFGRLSEAIEHVDEAAYDAIVLAYGLCSNGVAGLAARRIPLVLPRAHDCITLFLGSRERYLDYFQNNPGVYFKTTGWIERGEELKQFGTETLRREMGVGQSFEELATRYGEDNAKFLWEQLGDMTRNYSRITFIETGVEPDDRFVEEARRQAHERGWRFETLQGDLSLLADLVDGRWDADRFLVVRPGGSVAASYDEGIIRSENP
ncbi:MAG: DUF1638 domain-containing protein [Pirellulales bacterium]|nr:DUF1638 domain-containing protein [Pirellulales bacterium]